MNTVNMPPEKNSDSHLLDIRDLHVTFQTDEGPVYAVNKVSLQVERGEILGLVGESGCGKSAIALAIPRLLPVPAAQFDGNILLEGSDLLKMAPAALRKIRGNRIGVIFQDPMTALSPLQSIGHQLSESVLLHRSMSRAAVRSLVFEWLERVGIPDPVIRARSLPYQLSGGMQQRVMIAMALINEPDLLIADEPTTALDVTIQAQILELMRNLHRRNSGMLLITHDMGVVWQMCTRVAVMYAGEIVEEAPANGFFAQPLHPYSQALLHAMPSLATRGKRLFAIPGQVPSARALITGCRFCERCPYAFAKCVEHPELLPDGERRKTRCFLRCQ